MRTDRHSMIRRACASLLVAATPVLCLAAPDKAELPRECGDSSSLVTAKVCDAGGRCETASVMSVDDAWHGLEQCMRPLRDIWSRKGADTIVTAGGQSLGPVDALVARQLRYEWGRERVRAVAAQGEPVSMLLLLNDLGQPYNAMGQSGLAYFTYQFSALAAKTPAAQRSASAVDAEQYRRWGRALIRGVITPVDQGGLATWRDCDAGSVKRCAWFHSVTRRDLPTREGATLNQHLHAVRDMAMILAQSRRENWNEPIDLRGAYLAGLAQMVAPPSGPQSMPNLEVFLAPPEGAERVRWTYYGYNPSKSGPERTYFLDGHGRDCNYHFHVVDLLAEIVSQARDDDAGRDLVGRLLQCRAPLAEMLRTTEVRRDAGDQLEKYGSERGRTSKQGNARDYSCPAKSITPEQPAVTALRQQLSSCQR